jgi:hypothetical protein
MLHVLALVSLLEMWHCNAISMRNAVRHETTAGLDNPVGQYGRLLRDSDWRPSAKNQNGQRPRQGRRNVIASNQRPHVAAWQDRTHLIVILRLIWIIRDWCQYVGQDMELITPSVYQ